MMMTKAYGRSIASIDRVAWFGSTRRPTGQFHRRGEAGYYDSVIDRVDRLQARELRRESQAPERITAPVKVLSKIAALWRIGPREVQVLMDYDSEQDAKNLLDGHISLRGNDRAERLKLLLRIHAEIQGLIDGPDGVADWLRFERNDLQGQSVLDLILKGRLQDLLAVSELLAREAGR